MLFDRKFDLVVSLGQDCTATGYMRRLFLQDYSYPFDWLKNADFSVRVSMLINDFRDFFDKENIKPLEKPQNSDSKCDYYSDSRYGFYFYHDFPSGSDFEVMYPVVKAKYERRIERLYRKIGSSENILFVWWNRSGNLEQQTIEKSYDDLSEKFRGKGVYILIIEFSTNETKEYMKNGHVLVARFDNISYSDNPKWTDTMGNEANNLKIFRQIRYKHQPLWYLKYLLYKILKIFVELIPDKELRQRGRAEIKLRFFRIKL